MEKYDLEVLWNGENGFEVKQVNGRGRQYTVDLEKWTCSCGYFQLAGLPCHHAISAIYKCNKNIEDFIAPCYFVEVFNKIYEHCLQPVEGEEMWPVSPNPRPVPPEYVRLPGKEKKKGRPKNNDRRREETKQPKGKKMSKHGTIIKCSLCGNPGHNKSGCKQNPERGKKKMLILLELARKRTQLRYLLLSCTYLLHIYPAYYSCVGTYCIFILNLQQTSASASASAPPTTTSSVPTGPSVGTNRFKPPRKRTATAEAGSSAAPTTSTSTRTGSGAKRGRRPASSVPSFRYFTCSGNY